MKYPGRLALQQRVLPGYRVPFFDLLAESCEGGLNLFAGQPRRVESIATADSLPISSKHPPFFWSALPLLPTWIFTMVGANQSRRADRGGQSSLSCHALRRAVDAPSRTSHPRLGTRLSAALWTFGWIPPNAPPRLFAPVRWPAGLQSARRGRVRRPGFSSRENLRCPQLRLPAPAVHCPPSTVYCFPFTFSPFRRPPPIPQTSGLAAPRLRPT